MFFIDTNVSKSHTSASLQKEMPYGFRENDFCPSHGLSTSLRIPPVCSTIPWSLQDEKFFILRPVSLHGLAQIWIAITVYVLVAIVKKHLKLEQSLYTILQILSLTLFEKTQILEALGNVEPYETKGVTPNQLNLFRWDRSESKTVFTQLILLTSFMFSNFQRKLTGQ